MALFTEGKLFKQAGAASGGGSSYTAGTGIDITNDVISVGDTVLMNTSYSPGGNTNLTIAGNTQNIGGLNIGYGSSATATNGFAVGNGAIANGYASAVGNGAHATGWNSFAFGFAEATADKSLALGNAKTTATGAIQISGASSNGSFYTNSDANTFKVANENGNFELMNANGNLPADRLASTTGLADGNYRLRCTITNGVPTLSWVAE